jgi:nucleotide-binding universal stress UspA family protein
MTRKILVPIDFSPCSDAALRHALTIADENGAEVEVLYVWCVDEPDSNRGNAIFADTPQGIAMEERLTAAESDHAIRICGRLEFGDEPSRVILEILERERFDMVVMGVEGEGTHRNSQSNPLGAADAATLAAPATTVAPPPESGHVAANVVKTAPCKVITTPPPAPASAKIVAA